MLLLLDETDRHERQGTFPQNQDNGIGVASNNSVSSDSNQAGTTRNGRGRGRGRRANPTIDAPSNNFLEPSQDSHAGPVRRRRNRGGNNVSRQSRRAPLTRSRALVTRSQDTPLLNVAGHIVTTNLSLQTISREIIDEHWRPQNSDSRLQDVAEEFITISDSEDADNNNIQEHQNEAVSGSGAALEVSEGTKFQYFNSISTKILQKTL